MRINYTQQGANVSYSLSSVLCCALFSALKCLNFRISLGTGLAIFFCGIFIFVQSWASLTLKLGICPNLHHSTFCIPKLKQEEIKFKSSRVFEYGLLNGVIGAGYFICWAKAENEFFLLGTGLIAFFGIFIGKNDYLVSDFLGISIIAISCALVTDFHFPNDWIVQGVLVALGVRAIILNFFQKQLKETKSLSLVSLIIEGLLISAFGYFDYGIGEVPDILAGILYSIASYTYLEASTCEKSANFLSIFSLQIYAFIGVFSLLPIVTSAFGLLLLIFGYHIFRIFPLRMNTIITQNSLTDRFLP